MAFSFHDADVLNYTSTVVVALASTLVSAVRFSTGNLLRQRYDFIIIMLEQFWTSYIVSLFQ